VLYRGHLVEAGDAVAVIQAPRHPYTQLLVGSIPRPEPGRGWGKGAARPARNPLQEQTGPGCPFAARCPHVLPDCTRLPPPLRRTTTGAAAACHLLAPAAALDSHELATILDRPPANRRPRE